MSCLENLYRRPNIYHFITIEIPAELVRKTIKVFTVNLHLGCVYTQIYDT